jgi:hypothetical protein
MDTAIADFRLAWPCLLPVFHPRIAEVRVALTCSTVPDARSLSQKEISCLVFLEKAYILFEARGNLGCCQSNLKGVYGVNLV